MAFFAATLHVMTHVDGRDVNAYVPIRVFGRWAVDIEDSAGDGAVLRSRRGVLKHERQEGRNDAEPSFEAVVIVDDHLGEVEVSDRIQRDAGWRCVFQHPCSPTGTCLDEAEARGRAVTPGRADEPPSLEGFWDRSHHVSATQEIAAVWTAWCPPTILTG